MLARVVKNTRVSNLKKGNLLREVTVKIGLERIDIQEEVIVEVLLNSEVTSLVMSSEFIRKQEFKLKKINRPIYVRNVDGSFNKEGPIKHTVEVNIYYQGHRERTEIDVIGGQKQSMILGILQLAHHNPDINWKIGEVKIIRCLEEYGKQWRPKQEKIRWQKQKEKEARKEAERKQEKREAEKELKKKKKKIIDMKKIAEEQEIWDEEEEVVRLEEKAKKLVPERFHKQIRVFGKKQSERMPTQKL